MKLIALFIQVLSTVLTMIWLLVGGHAAPTQITEATRPSTQKAATQTVTEATPNQPRKASPVTNWQPVAEGPSLSGQAQRDNAPLRRPPVRRRLAQYGQL